MQQTLGALVHHGTYNNSMLQYLQREKFSVPRVAILAVFSFQRKTSGLKGKEVKIVNIYKVTLLLKYILSDLLGQKSSFVFFLTLPILP